MSGEGTVEIEATDYGGGFFVIAGEKSESVAQKNRFRLARLKNSKGKTMPLVDMVLWDAQNLPIRSDVVDVFVADLPFSGSQAKKHQTPTTSTKSSTEQALDYRSVMVNAVRSLRSGGKAALISADTKALVHSVGRLHWRTSDIIQKINLGGLNAQVLIMDKLEPCYKDLSVWIGTQDTGSPPVKDLSEIVLSQAQQCISNISLDELLEIKEYVIDSKQGITPLVTHVKLIDEYFHTKSQRLSHCYRMFLDSNLTNNQAKFVEKKIRKFLLEHPVEGISGFR
eukprot:CAMPEP_0176139250 /NCGR_PEP_ID=MMETSP0120_2-20121206/70748_1 /TAXON_ID=160619 /ORGANISM="Kryptoperidinium foliaceum, Strain CCMP 1326" /LENGTH=281 /DNA_ID=CAMNT_0017475229 /DNA_START=524 /DNA_END=1372 /DNA_ORIENTATION=-